MKTKLTGRGRPNRLAQLSQSPVFKPTVKPLDPPNNQSALMCHYCGYEPPMARIPSPTGGVQSAAGAVGSDS